MIQRSFDAHSSSCSASVAMLSLGNELDDRGHSAHAIIDLRVCGDSKNLVPHAKRRRSHAQS